MHYSTVTLLALSCMLLAFVNPGLAAAECVNGIQKEIIDNEDVTRFTTSGGAWTKITMPAVSNRARHYNETMMRTVKAANQVAYFDASGLSTGTYEVATFWQAGAARYPKVNYSIVHAGGVDMVKVNQRDVQPDIADFFVLGNYTFTNNQAGAGVYINSGPRNANIIIADAVSFSSVCTETSTSVSPTSASPTSASPTSASPTSVSPTSASPTSVSPTSASPTSVSPTSASPTSVSPTSASPTSVSPTSASPTSVSPTTAAGPDCPAGSVFEVTGADAYPDFNGCYKQDGTSINMPQYFKVNADGSFTDPKRWYIHWDFWEQQPWVVRDSLGGDWYIRYKVASSAATPPTTGWLSSDNTATNIALTYI